MSSASSVADDDASESDYGSDITIPVTEEQRECHFWRLPPELRLMVFELVYGEKRTVRITTRYSWQLDEKRRRRQDGPAFRPHQFPECSIGHLTVCKQFFDETVSVYMQSKTFDLRPSQVESFTSSQSPVHRYIANTAKSVSVNFDTMSSQTLTRLPRLSTILFRVDSTCVNDASEIKVPWRDSYTDLEIAQTVPARYALLLRGLSEVRVVEHSYACPASCPDEQKETWRRFLQQLESLVRDVTTQPRPSNTTIEISPSIEDALKMRAASAQSAPQVLPIAEANGIYKPLTDDEIPQTEAQYARLSLVRGQALFEWTKEAAKRLRAARPAQSAASCAAQPTDESSHAEFLNALTASEIANGDSEDDS